MAYWRQKGNNNTFLLLTLVIRHTHGGKLRVVTVTIELPTSVRGVFHCFYAPTVFEGLTNCDRLGSAGGAFFQLASDR